MKNISRCFIIFILLTTVYNVSGQKNPSVLLLDSVYTYSWVSNDWSLNLKEYCYKNGTGQTIQNLFKKFNTGTQQFLDYARFLNGYSDTITVPTTITDQFFYSNVWNTFQHDHYLARNIPDTTYFKNWDSQRHAFTYGLMDTYQYNDSMLPLISLTQGLDTTTQGWFNLNKTTNTYTSFMKPLEQIQFTWGSSLSVWDSTLKNDYVYDANNELISTTEYIWDNSYSNWISTFRTLFFYNVPLLPSLALKERWDTTLQVWDTIQQSLYFYNQINWLMTIRTQNYIQSTRSWVDNYLTFYTYNLSGEQNSMTEDIWDTIHHLFITDAYQNVDSATRKLAESYNLNVNPETFMITGGTRNVYSYASIGDSLNWVTQQWDVSANGWVNKSQVNYTYDSHNLLSEKVLQNWVNSNSSWLNTTKSDYFYSDFIGINEHPEAGKPCLYSNPMITGNHVYCPDFNPGDKYTLRVCSLTGLEVYRTNFIGGEAVSISKSLSPGLYFLIIEENGNIQYKDKVIILH